MPLPANYATTSSLVIFFNVLYILIKFANPDLRYCSYDIRFPYASVTDLLIFSAIISLLSVILILLRSFRSLFDIFLLGSTRDITLGALATIY